jgi:hypothetical protein
MVLWCRVCGALMGPREPLSDWSTVRTGMCQACSEKNLTLMKVTKKEQGESVPSKPLALESAHVS